MVGVDSGGNLKPLESFKLGDVLREEGNLGARHNRRGGISGQCGQTSRALPTRYLRWQVDSHHRSASNGFENRVVDEKRPDRGFAEMRTKESGRDGSDHNALPLMGIPLMGIIATIPIGVIEQALPCTILTAVDVVFGLHIYPEIKLSIQR